MVKFKIFFWRNVSSVFKPGMKISVDRFLRIAYRITILNRFSDDRNIRTQTKSKLQEELQFTLRISTSSTVIQIVECDNAASSRG